MKVLISILIIVAMIIVHEWGHFIAGRICKVPVYEFAIGFGPVLWKKKGKKETQYSVRAIPLGGFCSFDNEDKTGTLDMELNAQPLRKRMLIFVAGPLMNILTGYLIALLLFSTVGVPMPSTIVDSTYSEYSAAELLQPGDKLLTADGVDLNNDPAVFSRIVAEGKETPIVVEFERDGEVMSGTLAPKYNEEQGRYFVGIVYRQPNVSFPFFESIRYAFNLTIQYAVAIFTALGGLFSGKYSINDMSSIVGIVGVMTEYADASKIPMFLQLCAYITINLGIMNLLPIPGLDGSKILFGTIEGVTRKRVPEKFESYLTIACMALLLALSGYLIFHDIFKLII